MKDFITKHRHREGIFVGNKVKEEEDVLQKKQF